MEKKGLYTAYTHHVSMMTSSAKEPRGAGDFLKSDVMLTNLLPNITRISELQQLCSQLLPTLFRACEVLQYANNVLIVRTSNAAVATKLRQYLPKLQTNLNLQGWSVDAIHIKVHVPHYTPPRPARQIKNIPSHALSALQQLAQTLDKESTNSGLKNAIDTIIQRHGTDRSMK